jgi:hypothetical protein
MIGRDWLLLVAGTVLGMLSLTADLVGVGAFPGFGWKQIVGTAVALGLVVASSWRIYTRSREGSIASRPAVRRAPGGGRGARRG